MPGISDLSLKLLVELADVSLRSSILALFALLAIVIARRHSASARHAIWTTVLAGMLALPLMGLLLPPLQVKIAPVWRPAARIQSIQVPASGGTSGATMPGTADLPWSPRSPQPPVAPVWPVVLSVVYVAVALGLLVRLLVGYLLAQRLSRRSTTIREARAVEAFEDVAAGQGALYPLPALHTSDAVMVPLTIGWSRPAILLPSGWSSWDDWKLRAVLAHELAHIQRGDWLIAIAASINRSIFWFHPLAWWLERKLASLAEQASDDAALSSLGDAPRYASTILEFASALQATGGRLAQHGVAMARSRKVSGRIERVLALREPGATLVKKSAWITILACALPLIYSAAALQLNGQAPQQTEPPRGLDMRELLEVGNRMSASEAQKIEQQLIDDPEDLNARASLIAYYFMQALPHPWMQHVLWLIEHHPESEQAISFTASNPPSEDRRADFERVKSAWLQQAAAHPQDARVLAHVAELFPATEPFSTAEWLKRARDVEHSNLRWTELLSQLYARTVYNSTPRPPGFEHPDPAFASMVKSELESSSDAKLVGMVGMDLAARRTPAVTDEWQRNADRMRREYAEMLLKRAASLEPDNRKWSEGLEMLRAVREPQAFSFAGQTFSFAGPVAENQVTMEGPAKLRVPMQVQAANLIKQVPPEYPPLARQARLQGTVRFTVTIGRDGRIAQMELISGHPLLVSAAQDALAKWVYRPTLLNGMPAEIVTEVEVPFRLSE